MPRKREQITVPLTPQAKSLIERRLATGLYASAEEVIYEGLRMVDHAWAAKDEPASARLARSHDQARSGNTIDGELAFARLERRLRERTKVAHRKSA
jgi:Arc/MetJ-type ribon-helix-helix transcriptional regulator